MYGLGVLRRSRSRVHTRTFVVSPIRGGGKSSLLEHRAETYLKHGHTVLDFFGSRDGEGLAWVRNPLVDGVHNGEKKILLIHSDNMAVDCSYPTLPISQLSHKHIRKYDVIVSASPLHRGMSDEYSNVNIITDLIYERGSMGFTKLVVGIVREASNLYYCYDAVSETLTENGWKLFKDVVLGERVATRDLNGFIEYQYPSEKQVFDYEGNMIQIGGTRNGRYDLCVTPNHDHFVRASSHYFGKPKYRPREVGFVSANKIMEWVETHPNSKNEAQTAFELIRTSKWRGTDISEIYIPPTYHNNKGITIEIDTYLELLAWYLSDGNVSQIHDTSKGADTVKITKSDIVNPSDVADISNTLTKLGLNYNYYSNGIKFIINSAPLARHFKPLGYSYQKYIPYEVKNLPAPRLRRLIKTLCKGDGSTYRDTPFLGCYYSTSKRLADDVQEVAIKAGYNANMGIIDNRNTDMFIKGRKITSKRLLYEITISQGKDIYIRKEMVKRVPYKGKIYDLTVPKYHTLLIRRNGRVCWSGNSRLRVDRNQNTAKAYMIYLIREARHMGFALELDTLKYTSIDIDIRILCDYTYFKGQGYLGFPDDLTFLYRYFKPDFVRDMKPSQFIILSKKGSIGVGWFPEVKWHKQERENILANLGIKVESIEGMQPSYDMNRYKTVSDKEHVTIIESVASKTVRKRHGIDSEKKSQRAMAKELGRSPSTMTTQVAKHNDEVHRIGYCIQCRRAGGILYQSYTQENPRLAT